MARTPRPKGPKTTPIKPITDESEWLRVPEASDKYRVAKRTVYGWLADGTTLPGYRFGVRGVRIKRADIEALLTPYKDQ